MEDNRRGGFGRRTEDRREYGRKDSDRRPSGERRSFSGDRRSFGEGSDRPRRTFGDNDRPRRSFGDNDRPRRSSERDRTGQGAHSVTGRDVLSETVTGEVSQTEEETSATDRTSTISATRTKAESAR